MIIPNNPRAIAAAQTLLAEMLAIVNPSETQYRFTGALRKAIGETSNNDRRKGIKR